MKHTHHNAFTHMMMSGTGGHPNPDQVPHRTLLNMPSDRLWFENDEGITVTRREAPTRGAGDAGQVPVGSVNKREVEAREALRQRQAVPVLVCGAAAVPVQVVATAAAGGVATAASSHTWRRRSRTLSRHPAGRPVQHSPVVLKPQRPGRHRERGRKRAK